MNYFVTSDANDISQLNYTHYSQARIDSFIQTNPPLLSNDKMLLNQYLELCRGRKQNWERALKKAIEAQTLAKEIIPALKKAYHIE